MVDAGKGRAGDRPTHQSLGRGLRILEAIACLDGGASLGDVARRIGLARSTTHYLMQALVTYGYLRQEPGGRNYQLGLRALRLSGRSLNIDQTAAIAMPILDDLCRLTHESVAIGICQ